MNRIGTKISSARKFCIARRWLFLLKGLVACTSVAALTLAPLWEHLLFSEYRFHHPQPGSNDYLSGLFLISLFAAVLGVFFYLLRSVSVVNRKYIGTFFLLLCLVPVVNQLRHQLGQKFLPNAVSQTLWYKVTPAVFGIGFLIFARRLYLSLWKVVLICFPFLFIILIRLCAGYLESAEAEVTSSRIENGPVSKRLANKVVWIIFDELDYRLVFPERPKHISLPNFDRLAEKAINFTNAVPPARATILSIPSIIDGFTYTHAYPVGPNRLMLASSEGAMTPWGTRSNIFTDVAGIGGRCAVVGWYLPYTRIFGKSVHMSHWVGFSPESFIGSGGDFINTLKKQLIGLMLIIRQNIHSENQQALERRLEKMLSDPDFDLCFIHLPAPHLPSLIQNDVGTYFNSVKSYFGNLKVADEILGRCIEMVGRSSSGDKTTLIVSSDHSWRVSAQYDKKVDLRVPLMVRFAGQTSRVDIGASVQTVNTRKMVSEILRKKMVADATLAPEIFAASNLIER